MSKRSLYRYFSERRWTEAFLAGDILCRSLSYYRDYEDADNRRDEDEGNAIFRPGPGLMIHNETQNKKTLPLNSSFESTVRGDEVFVVCFTRGISAADQAKFGKVCDPKSNGLR